MTVINYYETLGVARDASDQDIKRAYHQAALQWHPDKNPRNREEAELRFKEITAAYEVIGNARSRAEYDLRGTGSLPRDDWADVDAAEEIFESFFGMFPETAAASIAADALLRQMKSFSFADAMIKFCHQKIEKLASADADNHNVNAPEQPQGREMEGQGGCDTREQEPEETSHQAAEEQRREPEPQVTAIPPAPAQRQRWCDVEEDGWEWAPPTAQATKEPATNAEGDTLRSQLRLLQAADQQSVLLVRGINRLGFGSLEALEEFFGRSGEVERVLVTHSKVKASGRRCERVRPAAIGFVLMVSREAAERQFTLGEHREIAGVAVRVQRFEHVGQDQASSD
jgi:curved DNA-binding protein CbpA